MASQSITSLAWKHVAIEQIPALTDDSLCVVYVPLCIGGTSLLSDSQRLNAVELLSDIQWDRFERRPAGASKETFLAGRYYLLNLLAHFTNQAANDVTLSYNRLNKPSLQPNPLGLEFNFSDTTFVHEDHMVSVGLFAFTLHAQVGVDIEAEHRQAASEQIAARRFTANELAFYYDAASTTATHSQQTRFLQIWTRKEAFGKACGLGINFKMNELDLMQSQAQPNSTPDFQHSFAHHEQAWSLQQFFAPQGEIACVTHAGKQPLKISAFHIDHELI